MQIKIESTSDTSEQVAEAMGKKVSPVVEEKEIPELADAKADDAGEKADASGASNEADEETEESTKEGAEESETEGSDQRPKKKNGFKKRIDKLSKQKAEAERQADYWRNEALKNKTQDVQESKPLDKKTDDSKKPNKDEFDTHDEYVEALTDWKVDQKNRDIELKRREVELKTQHQKDIEKHQSRLSEFVKSHDDFNDVIEEVNDIAISLTVSEVILASDNGPQLMYELAKNRDEYERINALPPIAAARELGKFEAKINPNVSSQNEQKPKTKHAPKPISPVGSNKSTVSSKSPDQMDYQEYKKWRQAQLRG